MVSSHSSSPRILSPRELENMFKKRVGKHGLKIQRRFTHENSSPFIEIQFEKRVSKITNPDGSVVFEMKDIEIPKSWSQVATDILAQKYFRKRGVPQYDKQGKAKKDKDGHIVTGSETSVKQVVRRLAGTWRYWGEKYGYFDSSSYAQAFEDELQYMLITQMAAPNSPQWFNTGLAFAYGITGEPQGHYYVDPETKKVERSKDTHTRPQCHACFIQSIKDDMVNPGGIFDLVTREARLFKYGSGTGTNFSPLRGKNEILSGGGQSSGLMSFLAVFDRAAGAIKSGGTTRRAAKMVCLDIDHPEVESFIDWKMIEEQKVAALHTGSYLCYEHLRKILRSAYVKGIDPGKNPELKVLIRSAYRDYVPLNYIKRVFLLAEQGVKPDQFDFRRYDTDFRSDAYITVGGQNSNNSVRVSNAFLEAVIQDKPWHLINRTDGTVFKTLSARELWRKVAVSAWSSADPGVQYDTTINEWHTCPEDGRINASNPCSEYMFLDDTACNLASLNLIKFYDEKTDSFLVEDFFHAVRLWTVVLEISVVMAQFPSKDIARKSFEFRTLGLGYANLGTVLMRQGISYDSPEALAQAGALSAILCGEAYATSSEMASVIGYFPQFEKNREQMLRVIRNHRRAAYNRSSDAYEGLSITPTGINVETCPSLLLDAARASWDRALFWGERYGYRNAQTTVIAPTGTIGLVMDCDTTGVEPDFALVKFKKLVGGGYFKIVNQSIVPALRRLGYNPEQIADIVTYCNGYPVLNSCPYINTQSLAEKGFQSEHIQAIEAQLHTIFELKFAFNKWALGEEFCRNILGITEEQLHDSSFNMLEFLGFTPSQIEEANEYVCGSMTIEGSPHLKPEHYSVFDCANRCGRKGERFIQYMAHVRMMGAVQPFISGAISKTINMPEHATLEDVNTVYMEGWKYMLKAIALYRDGSKLSQPLNTSSRDSAFAELFHFTDEDDSDETIGAEQVHKVIERIVERPTRRKLPPERRSITHKFNIAHHEGYLTVGLYDDGCPGELFIKMSKEGSTLSGIMDALALSVSLNLQYGVPLEVLVNKFTHARFEPSGMTSNKDIPIVQSIIDYLARWFALKFLPKEVAKKFHNAELVERAYREGSNSLPYSVLSSPFEQEVDAIAKSVDVETEVKKEVQEKTFSFAEKEGRSPLHLRQSSSAFVKAQANLALQQGNEDAPICSVCGIVMVRNGSCYKCIDCGETSGCS